ncbi:MAG TPA: hypothetical protein VGC79_26880 [Polyangiaceae bacterium]
MIELGKKRAFSAGLTLAALIAAGCAGKASRADLEPGSAGAAASAAAGAASGEPAAGGANPNGGGAGGAAPNGAGGTAPNGAGGTAPNGAGGPANEAAAGGRAPGAGGFPPITPSPNSGKEVALTPVDGWVDGVSNELHIQGTLYSDADSRSAMNLSTDFTGSNICIKGVAAKVDLGCTPVPPAPDCQMTTWGAAVYMNLNQPRDPNTTMAGMPAAFDGSALNGFAFELSGPSVPKPSDLRFQVETQAYQDETRMIEFCTGWGKHLTAGDNTVLFREISPQCFLSMTNPSTLGGTILAVMRRLKWQVLTNSGAEVPYDFCVSNVRAIYK